MDELRCDERVTNDPPAWCACPVTHACGCSRCSREDPEDRFHACAEHVGSDVVAQRHARIYPGHSLQFFLLR
jgi:hypothetical protein